MDAMKLLGGLMGQGGMASGLGGGLIGQVLGGALGGAGGGGGGLGGLASSMTGGSGGLGGLASSMTGGGGGMARGVGGGMLGGLAMMALKHFMQSRSGGGGGGGIGALLGGGDDAQANPLAGMSESQANDQAIVLIRAMINAAKSDGRVDATEQQRIVERLGDAGQEEIDFLRQEMAAPLDVDNFIRSVPRGMEQDVYQMSLLAIELDQQAEAQYLGQLASGMGLDGESCNRIHREMGAPEIFK